MRDRLIESYITDKTDSFIYTVYQRYIIPPDNDRKKSLGTHPPPFEFPGFGF
ncbi:MAG: hypothetical protein ACI9XC_002436 [Gammaproteobacteria bacterium]|jgi:hypothetical protein